MTDQLRTLAVEAFEADPNAAYPSASNAFVRGFIAGRTSVTREQVVAVMSKAMDGACACHLDSYISDGVNVVLALLNGESDDPC